MNIICLTLIWDWFPKALADNFKKMIHLDCKSFHGTLRSTQNSSPFVGELFLWLATYFLHPTVR